MLDYSELEFCKVYHLSESKSLDDIANNLGWDIGKVSVYLRQCTAKKYIVDGKLTPITILQITTIIEEEIKKL